MLKRSSYKTIVYISIFPKIISDIKLFKLKVFLGTISIQASACISSKCKLYNIFQIGLKPIFKFFLKSKNLNQSIMSLKSHSTETLT